VRRALGDGRKFGVHLEYVHEPQILGTSGALDNARSLLADDTFVVINGKLVTDIDLNAAVQHHREQNALATLVLKPNPARERFSIIETHDGLIKRFAGMPSRAETGGDPPLMFTGIHIMEPRIFDYIPRGIFSDTVINVYPQAMANGERIVAHVADGRWYELSTLQRYLQISLALLREQQRDIYTGANSQIDTSSEVHESILWDEVVVEGEARVRRAIIGDRVHIMKGEVVEDAVVVRADLVTGKKIPVKALKGEFRGDNFVVSLSQ
jgi:NDP-sugar pyrophosphorylase family protein